MRLKIILALLFKYCLAANIPLQQCDMKKCKGEYKISTPIPEPIKIGTTINEVQLTYYPRFIRIGMVNRQRLYIYSYTGGAIDPNSGTEELQIDETPDLVEARKWLKENRCPTGYECPPDGSCWGSDASKCFSKVMVHEIGPKVLKWSGATYKVAFHHACIQSWSCTALEVSARVNILRRENYLIPFYQTKDQEIIPINQNFYDKGFKTMDGLTHFPVHSLEMPKILNMKAKCYSSAFDNIKCIITTPGSIWTNKCFSVGSDFTGILSNAYIKIKNEIHTIKDGKIKILRREDFNGIPYEDDDNENAQKSASIESLKELVVNQATIQLQTIYDLIELARRTQQIEVNQIELLKHFSKLNGRVVGSILKEDITIKWINNEIFEICPCNTIAIPQHSNCNKDYIYDSGVLIKRNVNSSCISVDENKISNISLISEKPLDVEIIQTLPPQESSTDSDAWVELNKLRLQNIFKDDSFKRDDTGETMVNPLSILNVLPVLKSIFLYSGCFISWLLLILNVIPRFRLFK